MDDNILYYRNEVINGQEVKVSVIKSSFAEGYKSIESLPFHKEECTSAIKRKDFRVGNKYTPIPALPNNHNKIK